MAQVSAPLPLIQLHNTPISSLQNRRLVGSKVRGPCSAPRLDFICSRHIPLLIFKVFLRSCSYFGIYCEDERHAVIRHARHLPPLSLYNSTSSTSTESAAFFNRYEGALRAMPDLVTVVITSCNRPLLLQNTLLSFVKHAPPHHHFRSCPWYMPAPTVTCPVIHQQAQHLSHQQLHRR